MPKIPSRGIVSGMLYSSRVLLLGAQSLDMTTGEICYQCEGDCFVELIDEADYGSRLTSMQLAEIKAGLLGETDDDIHLLW